LTAKTDSSIGKGIRTKAGDKFPELILEKRLLKA
jgi:hypothetical protein